MNNDHSRRGIQFSVIHLLGVLTITSFVLAAYFSVGRALGMSNTEIGQYGLMRFVYLLPMVIVWAIGLMVALRRRKRDGKRATLLVVGFGGMIATALVVDIAHMVMIFQIQQGASSYSPWLFGVLSISSALFNVVWWIILLIGIFARPSGETVADDDSPPSGYGPSDWSS